MPGLEDTGNRAVVVPNQPLVTSAQPVVEPNAVSLLADSFRRGAITTDDIISRIGQVGQAKKKAELAAYQATARMAPLIERAQSAQLARSAQSDETLSESEKMAASFQSANVPIPKTPEGFVDIAAARATQDEINRWQAQIVSAKIKAAHIKYEKRTYPDGRVTTEPFSEVDGRFLSDAELGAIQKLAAAPPSFQTWKSGQQPATSATEATAPANAVPAPKSVGELPAGVAPVGAAAFLLPKGTATKPTVTAPTPQPTAAAPAAMLPNQIDSPDQEKLEQNYRQELMREFSSRSGPFGIEDSKVNQAIHLLSLFDQYRDPKTGDYAIPRVQQNELALGLARLISPGGNVGIELMRELNQKTAAGDLAGIITYFTGKPVTGTTQDILRMFKDSIERQGLIAEQNRQAYFDGLKALAPTTLDPARRAAVEHALKLNTLSDKIHATAAPGAASTATAPATGGNRVVIPGIGPGKIGPDGKFYPD